MRSSAWQRIADDRIGRLLIAGLRPFRRKRALPDQARIIVLLQPTAIGDSVLASGVVHAISSRYPNAELVVMHGPSNRTAFSLYADMPRLIEAHFNRPWKAIAKLRSLKPDLVVDLTPWSRTTALCAALSGAVTVGFGSEGQGREGAFDWVVPHRSNRHEFENIAAMAALFAPDMAYATNLKSHFEDPMAGQPWDRTLVLHPCAGGSRAVDKAWPTAHWIDLAQRMGGMGYGLAFTGTEEDRARIETILDGLGGAHSRALNLAGRLSLMELCGVLQRARALVTIDTAVLHIADALGTPVVALHGPTRVARWGPRSPNGIGIDSPHVGAGYISLGFERSQDRPGEAMAAISVEQVMIALAPRLAPTGVDLVSHEILAVHHAPD